MTDIENIKQEALTTNRNEVLRVKEKNKKMAPPLVFSTKFNPHVKHLKQAIRKHWHLLLKDQECKLVFPNKPIFAFGRHKNLKESLTSAVLK